MAFDARVLRVMVSSPSDVPDARDAVRDAVHEWTEERGESSGVFLSPWMYERDAVSLLGGHPQALINQQGTDRADVVVALFGSRLGSPTPAAASGTVEEIEKAVADGKRVHVYFSAGGHPQDVDIEQLKGVRQFKEDLSSRGLFGEFSDINDLRRQVKRALEDDANYFREHQDPPNGQPAPPPMPAVDFLKAERSADNSFSIKAHDQVHAELRRITELPALQVSQSALQEFAYHERIASLKTELRPWIDLTSVLAYWGNERSDTWWGNAIERFGRSPRLSGSLDNIESFTIPALVTLYAGGVAATAAQRWYCVAGLIKGNTILDIASRSRPASSILSPSRMSAHGQWPSKELADYLLPMITRAVDIDPSSAVSAWERFEYLVTLANTDRLLQNNEAMWPSPSPWIRVDDEYERARGLIPLPSRWLASDSTVSKIIKNGLFGHSGDSRLGAAMVRADQAITRAVTQSENAAMPVGVAVVMPSGVRRMKTPS